MIMDEMRLVCFVFRPFSDINAMLVCIVKKPKPVPIIPKVTYFRLPCARNSISCSSFL